MVAAEVVASGQSQLLCELRVKGRGGGTDGTQRWFPGLGPSNQVNIGTF